MNFWKHHYFVIGGLLYLWVHPLFGEMLLQSGWSRLFYLSTLPCAIAIVAGITYVGEAIRLQLQKRHWIRSFYSGANWVMAQMLGVVFFGHIAILAALANINIPLIYQLFFTGMVLLSILAIRDKSIAASFHRIHRTFRSMDAWKWLWLIPVLAFAIRGLVTFLLVNGTEQMHNTLPFAKYLFRGVDFNEYNLDTHFLLLGTYETFGVFIRAFTPNDFAFQLVAQQSTYLITIGGMCLILGTIPWVLRKLPSFAPFLMFWPTTLNFAPSDTIAFKPDWLAILSACIASLALLRQWRNYDRHNHTPYMIMVVVFSGIAACAKMTAVPYIIFLLPTTVLLAVWKQRRIHGIHLFMPILFFLVTLPFFGKNTIWLGNPVFPGFQSVFERPERLSNTTLFNTFKINKVTQNVPDAWDNLNGYLRFFWHHPEFFVPVFLLLYLMIRKIFHKAVLLTMGFFLTYCTLYVFTFYPSLYQRYVAYVYIILLAFTVLTFLEFKRHAPHSWVKAAIGGFFVLMLTHAYIDANLTRSFKWWGEGMSPQEYRFYKDKVDVFYTKINEKCSDPGRLLNRQWRNYFYADFDTISLTDLQGDMYGPEFYDRYNVNFVILPDDKMDEVNAATKNRPWFPQNFTKVDRAGVLNLWMRNSYTGCGNTFVAKN